GVVEDAADDEEAEQPDDEDDQLPRRRRNRGLIWEALEKQAGGGDSLEAQLLQGEKVLYAAELHGFILARPFLILVPALLIGAYFQFRSAREANFMDAHTDVMIAGVFFYLGGVAAACQFVIAMLRWNFTQFFITNRRLLIRDGLVFHRTRAIRLENTGMLTI